MKKTITIIAFLLTCLITCHATNNDQHLRLFVEKVNSASYSDALKELPLVSDWTNDNNLPLLDIDKFRSFLVYLSFFHTQKDSIWSSNHMNRLFVYIIPDFDQYINTCREKQLYTEAYRVCKDLCTTTSSFIGMNHPFYVRARSHHLKILLTTNNTKEAIEIYLELGALHHSLGNYAEAEQYLLECLPILEKSYSNDKKHLSDCHTLLGQIYTQLAKYTEAQAELKKGIDLLSDSIYSSCPTLADAHNRMGLYYLTQNLLANALEHFLKAEHIYQLSNCKSIECASSYADIENNLAQIYAEINDLPTAKKYLTRSKKIYRKLYGKKSPQYAMTILLESSWLLNAGYYQQADSCAKIAYNIYKERLPSNHPFFPPVLQQLSNLNLYINRDSSIQYIQEAIRIQKIICDSTLEYALLLMNYGDIYAHEYNFPKAVELYQKAFPIIEKNASSQSQHIVAALQSIAYLYTNGHKLSSQIVNDSLYALSELYLLKAKDILDGDSQNIPSLYSSVCSDLGRYYFYNKNYKKALEYYILALKKQGEICTENINYGIDLLRVGDTYLKIGKYAKAEKYLRQSTEVMKHTFIDSWDFLTETERAYLWDNNQTGFIYSIPALTTYYYPKNKSISEFAYDTELFTKGAVLVSAESIKESIMRSDNQTLKEQWYELNKHKNIINYMREHNAPLDSIQKYEQKAYTIEKAVTRSCSAYNTNQQYLQTSWKDVKQHLKANEVAIEFQITPTIEDSIIASYNALILRHNSKHPIFVPLFTNKETWELFTQIGEDKYSYIASEYELSQKIWKKILPYIKPKETVYFAPIGMLHQIAIENLPFDSTHSMGDIYNLVRLSSTREITSLRTPNTDTIAVLYGGIEYDIDSEEMSPKGTNRSSALYLEGTQQEIEEIHAILTAQDIPVTTYGDVNATEESFKALSGKHNSIIHIATHGFYWSDSTAKEEIYFAQRASTIKKDKHTQIDPLSRCGLLFAGANNSLEGNRNQIANSAQDGVLTAKEISTMDLHGTDIVVLSACETGLGEISADGVMGLQRAFKMAGVKTILMSLWQVDDDATKMLMSAFYRYWIGEKQAKRDAFRKAQNDVRAKYNSSEYWAGFILLD